jgi:hypothetical protein
MTNSSRKLALMLQAIGGTDADDAIAGDNYGQRHRALDALVANLNVSPARTERPPRWWSPRRPPRFVI